MVCALSFAVATGMKGFTMARARSMGTILLGMRMRTLAPGLPVIQKKRKLKYLRIFSSGYSF